MATQSGFAAALLDPALGVPEGLTDARGRPAGKRFSVYRNNVAVGLTEALESSFPVVARLVGLEFFAAMAGVYLRTYPPRGRIMMFYGAHMAEFLSSFEPVAHLPYLPDIARLEQALRRAYHAADAPPLAPQVLAGMAPDALMRARLTLAPALHLVRSNHGVHAIWSANTVQGAPPAVDRPEDVLILRPGLDPELHCLAPGEGAFLAALLAGQTFATAYDAALEEAPPFDIGAAIGRLVSGRAIIGLTDPEGGLE